jgi:glycosyltransferase involved in cell wall biosynthesis
VEDSGGGLVAPREERALAGAISTLLSDPERALSLGGAGREFWRTRLAPRAVCERHLEIYQELLALNGRAAA